MKFKSLLIIFLASLVLFGCELNTNSDKNQEEMNIDSSYIGGSGGLEVSFMENQPPSFVFDNKKSVFSVALQLKNTGEYDIKSEEVKAKLVGIDKESLDVDDLTESIDSGIRGKRISGNEDEIPGDIGYIRFEELSYQNELSTNIPMTLRAMVCYDYETNALVNRFCIKKDPLNMVDGSCQVSGSKEIDSSAAPVSVRNFKQMPMGENEIRFSFDVVHQGSGEMISPNVHSCWDPESDEINKVSIKIVGGNEISCDSLDKDRGIVKLWGGDRRTVRCAYDTSDVSTKGTEDSIQIVLKYQYKDSVQKNIMVKHAMS